MKRPPWENVPAKRKRAWGHFCMEPFSYNNYHYYSLLKCVFFFSWCHVIFYFEKPPNTFSLHLEFKNLSSSMIFLIGSRCHHFLFIKMCFFFSWWYHLLFWKTTEHIFVAFRVQEFILEYDIFHTACRFKMSSFFVSHKNWCLQKMDHLKHPLKMKSCV